MSELKFTADIDINKLSAKTRAIDGELTEMARKAANSGSMLDNSFKQAGKSLDEYSKKTVNLNQILAGVGAAVSLSALTSFAKQIANVRGEWQKYEAVLTNTLGSNQDAKDSLDMIAKYGAKTNFQVNELTESYVKLASQGFKPTRDELASLGDLAASKAKSFDQLTEAIIDAETFEFERLKEFGIRAAKNGDTIQFTFKGVKTTVDASAESVRNYILSLGQLEGVKGSTEAISKTIIGLASNFEDALNSMMNKLGQSQEGLIADSITAATSLVNNYESVIKVIETLIAVYGAYKAASIAVAVVETYRKEMLVTETVRGMYQMVTVTKELTFAQWASAKAQGALNVVTSINPYVAAATAVAGLVAMLYLFSDSAKEASDAQQKINDTVNTEKAKIESLITQIKSEKTANADRAKALKELNDLMPETVGYLDAQALSTKKGTDAVNEYIASIRKRAEMEQLTADLKKNLDEQDRIAAGGRPEGMSALEKAAYFSLTPQEREADQAKAIYDLKEQEDAIKARMAAVLEGKNVDEEAGKSALTVGQQLLQNKKDLKDAEATLREMRKPDSKATAEDIKKQADKVDALKEQKSILSGLKDTEKKNSDDLKQAQDQLEAAIKSGNRAAIEASAKRVTALENEKRALEENIKLELQRAWGAQFKGTPMTELTSIGAKKIQKEGTLQSGVDSKGNKIVYEVAAIDKTGPTLKKVGLEFGKLDKYQKDNREKAAKDQKELDKDIADNKKELLTDLINYSQQFTEQLIDQLGLTDQEANQLKNLANVAFSIASGDYLAAGFSMLTTILPDINAKQERIKQEAESVVALYKLQNIELERQLELLNQSTGQARVNEEKKTLEMIARQQSDLNAAAMKLKVTAKNGGTTYTYTNKNELADNIKNWENDLIYLQNLAKEGWSVQGIDEVTALIDEYKNLAKQRIALLEDLTATTSSNITDILAEGFANGKRYAADFSDDFESLMKAAVINAFKTQFLMNASQGFFDLFSTLSENGLTKEEIETLRVAWDKVINDGRLKLDEFAAISGIDLSKTTDNSLSNKTTLSGSVAGASEETVSLVAGQLMAMRVDIKENQRFLSDQLDLMDQSLNVLNNIDRNTRGISRLETIENELRDMNRTLKEMK